MRLSYRNIRLILLGVLIISALAFGDRAEMQREKYSRAKTEISNLRRGLERFNAKNGRYPTSEEGLGAVFGPDEMDSGIVRGGMTEPQSPLDPWGRRYFYQSDGGSYVLGSFGQHRD